MATIKEQTEKTEQLKTTLDNKVDSIGNIINTKIKEKPTTLTQVEDVLSRKMLGIGSVISPSRLELVAPYKILKQYNLAGHKIDKILAMSKSGKVACLMQGEDKTIYIIERDRILASFECRYKQLLGPTSLGFLGENTFYYSMYSTGYYGKSYGYALDINSGSQKSVTGIISTSNKIARSKENESRYFIAGDTNAFVYDVKLEKVIVSVGVSNSWGDNTVGYGGADVSSYGAVFMHRNYNSPYQTYRLSVNVISNTFETRTVYSREEKSGIEAFVGINTTKPIYYVASKSGANAFKVFDSTLMETTELMTEIPVTGNSQTPVFCTDKSGNLYLSQTKDSRSLTAIGPNGELIGFMKTPILPKNIGYVDDDTVCAKIGDGYCIATLQESPQYVII